MREPLEYSDRGTLRKCDQCGQMAMTDPKAEPGGRWCYDCVMEDAVQKDIESGRIMPWEIE